MGCMRIYAVWPLMIIWYVRQLSFKARAKAFSLADNNHGIKLVCKPVYLSPIGHIPSQFHPGVDQSVPLYVDGVVVVLHPQGGEVDAVAAPGGEINLTIDGA